MKRILKHGLRLLFYILIFIGIVLLFTKIFGTIQKHELYVKINADFIDKNSPLEVFYRTDEQTEFTQENSRQAYNNEQLYLFKLPKEKITGIRIDLGSRADKTVGFYYAEYVEGYAANGFTGTYVNSDQYALYETHELKKISTLNDGQVIYKTTGTDPYIIIKDIRSLPKRSVDLLNFYFYHTVTFVLSALITILLYRYMQFGLIISAVFAILSQRGLIFSLAKNDFKTRFAGSYFGMIWAFVQPICTILVFWFVFQIGFRNPNVGNIPYVLWFMAGLIPWFFFSESWNGATNAFIEYSYLVKKVVFKINILPMIKIMSSLFVHLFFTAFMMVCFLLYGRMPLISWVQIFYYMLCMIALVGVLSFITAPLVIFFRDLSQIMNIVLQFGMWLTPIMWSVDNLPAGVGGLINLFKLNPMFYIVQGYRNSMIYGVPFWQNSLQTVYFWSLILVLAVIGGTIYTKLKPHFSDIF